MAQIGIESCHLGKWEKQQWMKIWYLLLLTIPWIRNILKTFLKAIERKNLPILDILVGIDRREEKPWKHTDQLAIQQVAQLYLQILPRCNHHETSISESNDSSFDARTKLTTISRKWDGFLHIMNETEHKFRFRPCDLFVPMHRPRIKLWPWKS